MTTASPQSDVADAVSVVSLDQEGRGIARIEGKAVFIEGALPGEQVTITTFKRKPTYEIARADRIVRPSPARVTPRCPYFGVCGGCSLQHLDASAQVAAKQRTLEDTLWHVGRVRAAQMLPAIHGPAWNYRHRARLSVRHVPKKGGVLIGFHERKSSFVADMTSCAVLPEKISAMLPQLRALVNELSVRDRLPQIELAVGDAAMRMESEAGIEAATQGPTPSVDRHPAAEPIYVLVLRILASLSAADEERLRAFAERHRIQIYLQPGGPETASPFHPPDRRLAYTLPEFDLVFPYSPTEFTQVNPATNRVLVRRAITLLDPQPGERIADFFCGIGNFTLPIARRGALAIGLEGSATLIQRAQANAKLNAIGGRTTFRMADLFAITAEDIEALGTLDRALVDPPREGAIALAKALPADGAPRRIVYVSCNPATLARDAAVLVSERGYELAAAGVINMFPHTAHVESIAVFER